MRENVLYNTPSRMADACACVGWYLDRFGKPVTPYLFARAGGCSVYHARKLLNMLAAEGLLEWRDVPKGSNAHKRTYYLTETGETFAKLFGFDMPMSLFPVDLYEAPGILGEAYSSYSESVAGQDIPF